MACDTSRGIPGTTRVAGCAAARPGPVARDKVDGASPHACISVQARLRRSLRAYSNSSACQYCSILPMQLADAIPMPAIQALLFGNGNGKYEPVSLLRLSGQLFRSWLVGR